MKDKIKINKNQNNNNCSIFNIQYSVYSILFIGIANAGKQAIHVDYFQFIIR